MSRYNSTDPMQAALDYDHCYNELADLHHGRWLRDCELNRLRTANFAKFAWMQPEFMGWRRVAEQLEKEQSIYESESRRCLPYHKRTPTPILCDITAAAEIVSIPVDEICWLIQDCAGNRPVLGIRELLEDGQFEEVALQLLRMRRALNKLWESERSHSLDVISCVARKHFEWYGWARDSRFRKVDFILTTAAQNKRLRKCLASRRAEEEEARTRAGVYSDSCPDRDEVGDSDDDYYNFYFRT
ncbi:hypothetical protein BJ508DRAFT_310167 [Ascobolus immersus RN42]|uniref:Uncharacterized protein n=1 Tax=Ascobolus immersus RN42 TaxID=1160509 RepID=A0A3N4HWB3_ASCIM|nr:hypothetical protein BJ508DRAFT_310167 [Ascobolus immersus RN42]